MNPRFATTAVVLALGLVAAPAAWAALPGNVQREVKHLLGYVEESGCEFYRNGNWYDAQTAQLHLRNKYQYLMAADRLASTDDFIQKAATASSLGGQSYQVRCNGAATVSSSQWLRDELARFRAFR